MNNKILELKLDGDWTEVLNSPVAQLGFTAASAKNPLFALIPILTNTLAGGRHNKRVENALNDILEMLNSMGNQLDRMSDPSYKLVNEAILCIPHAVQDKKIEHIQTCIYRAIKNDRMSMHQATFIGRILRDISVEEANFLVENINSSVQIGGKPETDEIALGLRSLGLLINHTGIKRPVLVGAEVYDFTDSAKFLAELFTRPENNA